MVEATVTVLSIIACMFLSVITLVAASETLVSYLFDDDNRRKTFWECLPGAAKFFFRELVMFLAAGLAFVILVAGVTSLFDMIARAIAR